MTGFIETGLNLLRREFPRAYFLMCSRIGRRSIALTVGGELLFIEGSEFAVEFRDSIDNPDVRLQTDGGTILAAIDAELTLEQAVRDGRLAAIGRSEDLGAFHEALLLFVRGAVRSPSFPALLARFRWVVSGR
jgi:hypothetical protein